MKVLSLNGGSSSLRWGLFDTKTGEALSIGGIEEVHDPRKAWREARPLVAALEPDAVGHRVVHGGEHFTEAALIDDGVLAAIEAQIPLAPVHNPRCLLGIEQAREIFPDRPHVAVFDTAFHQTMPPAAYHYALPWHFFEHDRIRRYGFHGSSHRHAAESGARLLGKAPETFTGVTVHLGNGCSIAAIENGCSVDTSMGMTPLEGLMMGTRSGDVDPGVVLDLAARGDLGPDGAKRILNEESGLRGVSGVSSDLREVEAAADAGNERAKLARELFAHRVRRGLGAALGVLGGAEAIVLTGGIGEHGVAMRERILCQMEGIGIELDRDANRAQTGGEGRISRPGSRIAIFVVEAREEWSIARETASVVTRSEAPR